MLIRHGTTGKWEPPKRGYGSEDDLQRLIEGSPDLLPGLEGIVASAREVRVKIGSSTGRIDNLCLDANGHIAIVECKLGTNDEIKREVVGQVLSYAAALSRYSFEDLNQTFEAATGRDLRELAAESVGEDEFEPASFEAAVSDSLRKGSFTLVVVVDEINDELKGIVEYLNTHSSREVSVLALELRRFHEEGEGGEGGIEILLPVLYGAETASPKVPRHAWTKEEFARYLEEHSPTGAAAFAELVSRAECPESTFLDTFFLK